MVTPRIIPCLTFTTSGLVKTTKFKDPKFNKHESHGPDMGVSDNTGVLLHCGGNPWAGGVA